MPSSCAKKLVATGSQRSGVLCSHLLPASCFLATDTTLASLRRHCGGHASLDQEPAGHVNLTLSGPFANTATPLNSTTDQSNETLPVSVCTWTISIPADRTVLLKLLWLESGSSITVRCLRNEEDRVLEIGGTALLSSCFGNKATLSWTGEGRSSNPIQLSYYGTKVSLDYPLQLLN